MFVPYVVVWSLVYKTGLHTSLESQKSRFIHGKNMNNDLLFPPNETALDRTFVKCFHYRYVSMMWLYTEISWAIE
jgi:hypothetical protein